MKSGREGQVSRYITEAMMQLIKRKEYRDITVTELCGRAGVTRMSFYRNFKSREDVLRRWAVGVTDEFVRTSGIDYKNDPPEKYFVTLFTHLERYREECAALYRAGQIQVVKEQFDRVFRLAYGDEYGDYKAAFLAGGIYNVFLLWLTNGCREGPEELAARLTDILTK